MGARTAPFGAERYAEADEPAPLELLEYRRAAWPGGLTDSTAAWGRACREWLQSHPGRSLPHSAGPEHVHQAVRDLRRTLRADYAAERALGAQRGAL